MTKNCIRVVGAREHNLKNISVDIPRDQLVVISRNPRDQASYEADVRRVTLIDPASIT